MIPLGGGNVDEKKRRHIWVVVLFLVVDAVGGGGHGRVGERGVETAVYIGGENRKPRS